MEAILQSFGLVLVSEMGDKTQLLALVLAVRFKKPAVVLLGIMAATLLNHGIAAAFGSWLGSQLSEHFLKTALAILFFAFAIWILVPDKLAANHELGENHSRRSAFFTTLIFFFLAEMGDKTQLATLALGAKFQQFLMIAIGTTLGMLVADGLIVFFGESVIRIVPMKVIRVIAATLFALFGLTLFLS